MIQNILDCYGKWEQRKGYYLTKCTIGPIDLGDRIGCKFEFENREEAEDKCLDSRLLSFPLIKLVCISNISMEMYFAQCKYLYYKFYNLNFVTYF